MTKPRDPHADNDLPEAQRTRPDNSLPDDPRTDQTPGAKPDQELPGGGKPPKPDAPPKAEQLPTETDGPGPKKFRVFILTGLTHDTPTPVQANEAKARTIAVKGKVFEHVSETPDGEWVYRFQN